MEYNTIKRTREIYTEDPSTKEKNVDIILLLISYPYHSMSPIWDYFFERITWTEIKEVSPLCPVYF